MTDADFDFDDGMASATVEWAMWHLTPTGWQKGSFKTTFEEEDVPVPKDRLLSYLYKECLEESFKTELQETFRCKENAGQIDELINEFGPAPKEL